MARHRQGAWEPTIELAAAPAQLSHPAAHAAKHKSKVKAALKVTGAVAGVVHEDSDSAAAGLVKVKGAKGAVKITKTFVGTDHASHVPLGVFALTGTKAAHWSYALNNADASVQALGQDEQVHETYKLAIKSKGVKTVTKVVHVTIVGTNDAPVVTSHDGADSVSIDFTESAGNVVTTIAATDADQGSHLTFTLIGADAARFDIDADGVLSFRAPLDFDAAADADGDNHYEVVVRVSDGISFDEQVITVVAHNAHAGIDLGEIASVAGFRIFGADAHDWQGRSVAAAGDVNGDGFDDVIVGAPFADGNGRIDAGASYVLFGKPSGFTDIDLSNLAPDAGFLIFGADAGDNAGWSVASAGDVNGDGLADVILSARFGDAAANSKENAGECYVIFGRSGGFPDIDLASLSVTDGFRIFGANDDDQLGISVAAAGDVNGDGFADLIIGASKSDGAGNARTDAGTSYVIFGKAGGFADVDLAVVSASAGFRIVGADSGDLSGISVAGAGDINGDGFADLIVGASSAAGPGNGRDYAGECYVIFGKASGFTDIDLGALAASGGFRIFGADAGDNAGVSVASAGDVNGDGFADLIIGACKAGALGNAQIWAGESYVVFGKAAGFADIDLATLDPSQGFRLFGADAYDQAGRSVASAGDVNGDGFDDLIIGAPYAGIVDGKSVSGESYVVFGKASGFGDFDLSNLGPGDGFKLIGADEYDFSGVSVASAGDVNGDGFADIIIGAFAADALGNGKDDVGESYVVFGANFGGAVTTGGTQSAELLIGGSANDVLIGGGGADVFHAGAGDDTITVADFTFRLADGGSGTDRLVLQGAGVTFDFTTLADSKTRSIETIDFTGTGNNTLKLGYLDALNFSTTPNSGFTGSVGAPKAAVIDGDGGDAVLLASDARGSWIRQASNIGLDGTGTGYDVWSFDVGGSHLVKLAIDHDVGVTLV